MTFRELVNKRHFGRNWKIAVEIDGIRVREKVGDVLDICGDMMVSVHPFSGVVRLFEAADFERIEEEIPHA